MTAAMQKAKVKFSTATVWLATLLLPMAVAAVETPRLVIAELKVSPSIGSRERGLVPELRLVDIISESLTDSRSFQVQMRDNLGVQELLKEKEVQESPLGRKKRADDIGLDAPNYILLPTLESFSVSTRFEKLDVIAGMYERIDTGNLLLHVRITDMKGNVVFQESSRVSASYPRIEATEEQKRRPTPPPMKPLRVAATQVAQGIVDAIVARINPITVLEVQERALMIDRGRNSGFDEKTVFGVYGQPIIKDHANTGVKILSPGAFIGQAHVVAIHEEVTELELIKGDITKVVVGSIVRVNRKAAP